MAKWEFYRNASGRRVVAEEVLALGLDARGVAKWDALLTAIRTGVAKPEKDFKLLKGRANAGLAEVIMKYDGNAYRLIYSIEEGDVAVLLAVTAFVKKSNQTPAAALRVARSRRRDWQTRQRDGLGSV